MQLPNLGRMQGLELLFTLLPGLLTYLLVRSLTARERRVDATEAVLQGLAYTLVVHAMWAVCTSVGSWIPTPDIVGLSLCAVVLAFIVSHLSNRGFVYGFLRQLGITEEPGWATIWDSAFREFRSLRGEYAVFHLGDGRRIMGAIRGHSSQQAGGHICLERAQWLEGLKALDELPGMVLMPADDVQFVEFIPIEKSSNEPV